MKRIKNKTKLVIITTLSIFMLTTLSIPTKADEASDTSILSEDNINVDIENTNSMLGIDENGNQVKINETENIIIEDIDNTNNENTIKEETNEENKTNKENNQQETNNNETLQNQIISIDEKIPDSDKINPKKENSVEIKDTIVEELEQEIVYEKDINNIETNETNSTLTIVIVTVVVLMIVLGIGFFVKKKNKREIK